MEYGQNEKFWSDFTASTLGSASSFTNGATDSKNTNELGIDYAWKDGVDFNSGQCVKLKGDSEYALEPSICSDEAHYICAKDLCGGGFQWYDMKSCAKVMDSTSSKQDALAACKGLNPGATLLMPKTKHDQNVMEDFLRHTNFHEEVYLGAEILDDGHWFWDDGNPLFVSSEFNQLNNKNSISHLLKQDLNPYVQL